MPTHSPPTPADEYLRKTDNQRELEFQRIETTIDSALFQHITLSKDKKGVLAFEEKGHELIIAKDAIKDPYIFEFLKLPRDKVLKKIGKT